MGKLSLTLLAVCGLVLTACASTPKIKVNYYLAETALKMKVVRTVGCNEGNYPIIATTVTPTVSHSADAKKAYPVELAKLNSTWPTRTPSSSSTRTGA